MSKKVLKSRYSFVAFMLLIMGLIVQPASAQSTDSPSQNNELESLRSDVGIHGLTANLHFFNDATYLGNDTLSYDGSSELEFIYRDIRMMSPRLGVGFQILGSFFTDAPNSSFGVGSIGAGPVVRAYPFRTDRFLPYVQFNSLFGKDLAVGSLANTNEVGDGFRVRLGLRAGAAVRITNSLGLFTELGYDWESSRLFKADARALQFNVGFDYYLFN